ncbi:ABC transporter ATP-binding protein [Schaalia hyovaginalis]|uniref:Energy-coupling factor transport system ATP-binding protein n=1 Tax=Schaalia hyovaginalis TaxID=29316 RepID=A0A923E2G9_9ACTO|nr:DUF2232 domain-containing protein [Schaalia hyovaginalis]MBB6333678.1 energy-coupling factor transport system ATP-binding protein [Schaalia hyovaginalis]MDY2669808.1 DUF2232 domain-containing protein [Schaalia hyovaginalis]
MTGRRTPLAPVEIATAGILAGLTAALGLGSSALPVFALFFRIGAAIPIAMVASRMRPRTAFATALVALLLAGAVGGISTAWTTAQVGAIALVVGALRRKGVAALGVALTALLVALIGALGALALLTLLESARELALESARTSMNGYLELVGRIPGLGGSAQLAQSRVDAFIAHWWIWAPALSGLRLAILLLAAHWLLSRVLERLDLADGSDPLEEAMKAPGRPGPLPLRLRGVGYAYPGSDAPALSDIDLDIDSGFTVIVGPNGSGKSTLALILAGAAPTRGSATRPGGAGLGRVGGTAILAQRAETQFLGETVAEDVVWGMGEEERAGVDLDALLDLVGLRGQAQVAPRHLSGGMLQRLALAGALARRPALLISDESTAMIDPRGRAELLEILSALPASGTAVVHITHDPAEAANASRIIRLEGGRILHDGTRSGAPRSTGSAAAVAAAAAQGADHGRDKGRAPSGTRGRGTASAPSPASAPAPALTGTIEHLWADRVTHSYNPGTPWDRLVLSDASCIVSPGSALLITGENGSGKSTLARILVGLESPTSGRCTLGGVPVTRRIGEVGLARQFARLQLQRPTVGLDILSAAGYGPSVGTGRGRKGRALDSARARELIASALAEVGLPEELSRRNVDALSGGQMRRVVLAGLLASDPVALVLDEPFAGLDAESRAILIDVLERRRRAGLGLVIISHDDSGLTGLCDEQLTLARGVLA